MSKFRHGSYHTVKINVFGKISSTVPAAVSGSCIPSPLFRGEGGPPWHIGTQEGGDLLVHIKLSIPSTWVMSTKDPWLEFESLFLNISLCCALSETNKRIMCKNILTVHDTKKCFKTNTLKIMQRPYSKYFR